MPALKSSGSASRRPIRLWPGIAAAVVIVLLRLLLPLASPDMAGVGVIAGMTGGLAIILWWLLFSRAPWSERIGAIALMAIAVIATKIAAHESIAGGMMGMFLPVYAIPLTLGPAFVAWAALSRHLSPTARWATMIVTIFAASGVWLLARTDGVMGSANSQLAWRWTPTAEQRLLAQVPDPPRPVPADAAATPREPRVEDPAAAASKPTAAEPTPDPAASTPRVESAVDPIRPPARVEWTGFRGNARDGVVRRARLLTDWSSSPPVELWRRPVGPGWSSFAVAGDLIYTQEQRGEEEMVSCYLLTTGAPVWAHGDPARFYESNGGPGPRATPTVHGGRVYSLGATGIVNALDAKTGVRIWTRNAESDTGAPRPGWGFAGSPLVVGDALIVAASGRLVAYDLETGEPRWTRTTGGGGYSSPHLAQIAGVPQILLMSGGGITSVAPADGSVLWSAGVADVVSIVQPAIVGAKDVLVASGDMMGGSGIRRISVSRQGDAWSVEERWTTRGLKPYFSDFVVHEGHAFGFDGTILSAIDIESGERKWKGGRYGAGQMLLLAEQDVLLVMSEEGEVALVSATPEEYREVTRFKAIEGKTWNHPVVAGGILFVRNGEEMAAFRLPMAER